MKKNGFSLLVIIVGIFVLILLGLGGYSMLTQETGMPQLSKLPNILPFSISEDSLQGIWTVKELYATDPVTGEFKSIVDQNESKKNSYMEFKGNQFCGGQLDSERKPQPCPKYQSFSVSGDKITLQDPSQAMTVSWRIVSGDLELIPEAPANEGKVQKIKIVLKRL
jgi:hypothetical protein